MMKTSDEYDVLLICIQLSILSQIKSKQIIFFITFSNRKLVGYKFVESWISFDLIKEIPKLLI